MYKGKINILLKPSIFDPQGDATKKSLKRLGITEIEDVRIGRYIEIKISAKSKDEATNILEKAIKELLVNPIIETYQYEIIEEV
jgi:phosphoribosylformylglycinamidine synthase